MKYSNTVSLSVLTTTGLASLQWQYDGSHIQLWVFCTVTMIDIIINYIVNIISLALVSFTCSQSPPSSLDLFSPLRLCPRLSTSVFNATVFSPCYIVL